LVFRGGEVPSDAAVFDPADSPRRVPQIANPTHRFCYRAEKTFRADLYYRLNVFPISLPPLRERRGDVRLLAEHFVRKFSEQQGKMIDEIPEQVMITLEQHCWPGNIRELQNVIERGVIMTSGSVLSCLTTDEVVMAAAEMCEPPGIKTLAEAERAHIIATLRATKWVIGGAHGAAAHLGLPRTTLLSRMQRLGISNQDAKAAYGNGVEASSRSENLSPRISETMPAPCRRWKLWQDKRCTGELTITLRFRPYLAQLPWEGIAVNSAE